MALDSGTRLGPFTIEAPIGAGGMGEVYRAHDTKLDRAVAIKVLSSLFADDPERLARFEREARAVAALSHPNILAIHDFGRDGSSGVTYAAMELLEGETLRERLAGRALAPRKAIEYGVQIVQGLAAAHDKGIAHRDLKPENLFITRDDRVKILDFGLAKPLELASTAATVAGTSNTAAGTIMGTVGYMAPEQVRGQATDHRSDIFAFGSVLYEMLTGRRAFGGDSPADTMSAILNTEPPDLDALAMGISPALDRIVRRCLEKKPELRFQSARDLAFALDTLTARTSGAVTVPSAPAERAVAPPRTGVALPWTIAALATATALAAWVMASRAPAPEPRWQTFTSITDAAGEETSPAISPDGSTIAYTTKAAGTWDIYVQRVGGRNATPVGADPERHEASPAFSPDGKLIAFHESDEDGGIFVAGATGESIRRVTDGGFHPAWSPDGARIAYSTEEILNPASRQADGAIWIAEIAGGAPQKLEGTGDAAQPSWAPSGQRLVYWSNTGGQRDLYTIPVAGGARTPVVEDAALDWSPVWAPDGDVYFASDRGGAFNLWRVGVDQASGRVDAAPEPVTLGVSAAIEQPSISKDGKRLVFRSRISAVNPVAIPFDPATGRAGTPQQLRYANGVLEPHAVSPDGRSIAYSTIGDRHEDISIGAPDGTGLRRITDDAARDRGPVWLPDGRSLVFYSSRGGTWEIWRIDRDGGNLQKIAGLPERSLVYPVVSRASRDVIFSAVNGGLFRAPLDGASGAPVALGNVTLEGGALLATSWSPDGTRLAGPILSPGGRSLGVAIYDLASKSVQRIATDDTNAVRWLSDGRRLVYFTPRDGLVLFDTASAQRVVVDVRLPLAASLELFGVAPDDRTIYYGGIRSEADIWIVERQ
jgi:Tol biopolymer transport system component